MANKPASEQCKASSAVLASIFATAGAVVRDDKGAANINDTMRAFGIALRNHLRGTGELATAPRGAPSIPVDMVNVTKGCYAAFLDVAKKGEQGLHCALSEFIYASLAKLSVPFDSYERARKIIQAALVASDSPFKAVAGARKFDGTTVYLKAAPVKAPVFKPWTIMVSEVGKAAASAKPAKK